MHRGRGQYRIQSQAFALSVRWIDRATGEPCFPFLLFMDKLSPSGQNRQTYLLQAEQTDQSSPFPCTERQKIKKLLSKIWLREEFSYLLYGSTVSSLPSTVCINFPSDLLYKVAPCAAPSLCCITLHRSTPPPLPLFSCSSVFMFLSFQMETIRLPLPHWMMRGILGQFQPHKEQKTKQFLRQCSYLKRMLSTAYLKWTLEAKKLTCGAGNKIQHVNEGYLDMLLGKFCYLWTELG